MGKTKFEHYDRCDLVKDPDWEIAMEVSVKYIAKIMNKMQCGKAMADGGFGVPPKDSGDRSVSRGGMRGQVELLRAA